MLSRSPLIYRLSEQAHDKKVMLMRRRSEDKSKGCTGCSRRGTRGTKATALDSAFVAAPFSRPMSCIETTSGSQIKRCADREGIYANL